MQLSGLERDVSSRNIHINNYVLTRVDDLEHKGADLEQRLASIESAAAASDLWQPVGTPAQTHILLLGDSNSGGKIKFGEGRGILGGGNPQNPQVDMKKWQKGV